MSLFDDTVHLPILRLELCLEDGVIFFYPSIPDFEAVLELIVTTIAGALQDIGKIQVRN